MPSRPKTLRKVRSDSIIFGLPDEDQEKIFEMLKTHSAERVAEYLISEKIVKSISERAVQYFRGTYQEMKDRMAAMVKAQTIVLNILKADGVDISAAAEARRLDDYMLLKIVENGDAAEYVAINKLKIARQQLEIDKRKVATMEKKAGMFDEAKKIKEDVTLTPEQREAALANILK